MRDFLNGKPHRALSWRHRRNSLFEAAGAADLRALRHHRSFVALGLHQPRRLSRPGTRAEAHARSNCRRSCEFRPARARRRRLSHRHQVAHGAQHADADQKYIVCNADEGDSGTYADRMIMEGDPFRPDRGHDHRRLRRRRHQRLYLRSFRISARFPDTAARHRHRLRAKAISARMSRAAARRFDLEVRLGRGSVHLRRRNLPARKPRRQARPDSLQAAAARHQRPFRQADRGQQCDLAVPRCRSFSTKAPSFIAISAWANRAAR